MSSYVPAGKLPQLIKLILLSGLLYNSALSAATAADKAAAEQELKLKPLFISTPTLAQPTLLRADTKQPRQPVPASDAGDYLKTFPGFNTVNSGATNGDPVLRGMFGSRIGILLNDAEIYGGCGGRMDPASSYIAPELYDEMVVIKGPQTVAYGGGFSAGVVRFNRQIQRFNAPEVTAYAAVLTGSHNRLDQLVDVATGNQQLSLRLNANNAKAGDYRVGNRKIAAAWRKWNADLSLAWTPNSSTAIELSFGRGDGSARYATRAMDGTKFERRSWGIRAEKIFADSKLSSIQVQINRHRTNHVMDNFSLRPTVGPPMLGNPKRSTYSARLAADWLLNNSLQLNTGIDAVYDEHLSGHKAPPPSLQIIGYSTDTRINKNGVFAEGQWDIKPTKRLLFGFRLNRDTAKLVKKSADWRQQQNLLSGFARYEQDFLANAATAYLGLGYSSRSPDFWELRRTNKTKLAAEKTLQLDAGLQYETENYNLWSSVYLGKLTDFMLIDYQSVPKKASLTSINAQIAGAELGASYNFSNNLSMDAALAYAWGQNKTAAQPLPQIPPLEAKLALNYQRGNFGAAALLRSVAAQKRIALGKGTIVGKDFANSKAFTTLAVNAFYLVNQQVSINAGVDNLFNKQYREHLNKNGSKDLDLDAGERLPNPGRSYWLKLTMKY